MFDLQLKESELVEAAATLRLLEEHSEGALTTARSLQLAVRKREWQKAISDLKKLCVMPDAGDWALPTAVNEMKAANRSEEALDTLDEALDWPDAIPKVGALWMKGCLEEEDHQLWFIYFLARRLLGRLFESRYAKFLQELTAKGAIGERATATYLGHLIEWGRHSELRRFIRCEGHWLRKNDATWYYTADALQRMGSGKERRGWALHWRELKEPEAWMLLLAAELFWEHGQMDEAGAVCQAALKLPADGSTSAHRILLSAQMVLAGDTERAGMELAPVDSSTLNNYGRFIYQMTDAAVQISAAAPSDRWKRFKGVRRPVQDVVKAVREERRKNRAYRRLYRQALWHIGREVGDIRAWIWCLWMFLRW